MDFGSDYFSDGLTCVSEVTSEWRQIPVGSETCTFFASFWLGPTSVPPRTFPLITRISTEGLGEISSAVLEFSAIVVMLLKETADTACMYRGGESQSSSKPFRHCSQRPIPYLLNKIKSIYIVVFFAFLCDFDIRVRSHGMREIKHVIIIF